MSIDLSSLSLPFPIDDIEWRVSRSGMGAKGIFCMALCYITARAIQKRLDDVCGPENWRVEEPRIIVIGDKPAFAVGISIRVDDEWITKWDVCEPTNIEAAKGGFSGAMKRAGAQWGIGRYLYYLDETFAEVSESQPAGRHWNWAKLPEKHGGASYWWKAPGLPAWALPMEPEHEVSENELNQLKREWKDKFAPDNRNHVEASMIYYPEAAQWLGMDGATEEAAAWAHLPAGPLLVGCALFLVGLFIAVRPMGARRDNPVPVPVRG